MHYSRIEDIRPEFYRDWLKKQREVPVYMLKRFDEIPMSIPYPKKTIIEEFGTFFTCSVCWILALGIYEGFEEIHLYGVHAKDGSIYESQKPGITFFLGVCRGRRIKYYVPPESDLLKIERLYGYEERIKA